MRIPTRNKMHPYIPMAKEIENWSELESQDLKVEDIRIWFSYYSPFKPDSTYYVTGGGDEVQTVKDAQKEADLFVDDMIKSRIGDSHEPITLTRREKLRQHARSLRLIEWDY